MKNTDAGFENYRRERQRRRLQSGETFRPLVQNEDALRELEQAEAREVQDRRLTREVHEFFSEATKTAASIVQKVSDEHQEEAGEKLSREMEEFLMDSFRRMNAFVTLVKGRSNPDGPVEQILEADMQRLVGPVLDAFRKEGTAELDDKHIGQDPFDTEVESEAHDESETVAVVETDEDEDDDEIRVMPATGPSLSGPVEDIEDHLVAELHRDEGDSAASPVYEEEAEEVEESSEPEEVEEVEEPEEASQSTGVDLERLKVALRTLVRQGLMTKDEARAKYREALDGVTSS